jgi:uncharacterized Zn finger protein (UPF0148 family)
MSKTCGDCGHPLRKARDKYLRCPKCESEFFVNLNNSQKVTKNSLKELKSIEPVENQQSEINVIIEEEYTSD